MSESTPPPNDDSAPTPPYASSGMPGPGNGYRIGAAVRTGFRVFGANVGAFVVMVLLIVVVEIVFVGLALVTDRNHHGSSGFHLGGTLAGDLLQLLGTIGATLLTAGLVKGALDGVDGRPVSLGSMFEGWDKAQIVIAAVLVGLAEFIGLMLFLLPGLILAFLLYFTNFAIVDEHVPAVDGLRRSVRFTGQHVRILLGTAIVAGIINFIGGLLFGIGLLVTLPVTTVMGACAWRQLQGRPVATSAR